MEKNKPNLDQDTSKKVELAKSIASRGQKVARTYASLEDGVARLIKTISYMFDRFVFNPRLSGIVSFILALLVYLTVNNGWANPTLSYAESLGNVALSTTANTEVYEIVGLPENVEVTVMGEMSDIQMTKSTGGYKVVADLSGLTEGTHTINFVPTNFSDRVNVICNPSSATVTIRRKISWKKNLTYDYINTDKMDARYILGEPNFETEEIIVRASQETVNNIALVKALIDVSNVTGSFDQEAPLVAFDNQGNRIDVDMVPSSVHVNVNVSSPNKTVPIILVPRGEIPNNKAISEITMDQAAITIYAAESVLNAIDNFTVEFDVSEMVSDSSLVASIKLPSGVKSTSISKVNLEVKLVDAVTKVIENVRLSYVGLDSKYKFDIVNSDDMDIDIEITGSPERVEAITAADLEVFVDMSKVGTGKRTLEVFVKGSDNLLKYKSLTETVDFVFVE